jgi:hypothetical protein
VAKGITITVTGDHPVESGQQCGRGCWRLRCAKSSLNAFASEKVLKMSRSISLLFGKVSVSRKIGLTSTGSPGSNRLNSWTGFSLMSRISHFNLYKCGGCGQISARAVWGTIGPRIPYDMGISSTVSKTCPKCGETKQINSFLLVGSSRLSGGHIIEWILPNEAPAFPSSRSRFHKFLDVIFRRKWKLQEFPFFEG